MNNRVHDFQESLKLGKEKEAQFLERFKDKLEWLQGKGADFKILRTGETIETKADNYDPAETPNFYMEKYSHTDAPGGAFQAAERGTTYYVYWFVKTGEIFCYRTTTLVAWLNANHPKPWLISVKNKGHTTRGFIVKRAALKEIELNLEDIL